MPSYDNERFQPPPPIRTDTSVSHKSQSSGTASPGMLSPTSTFSPPLRSPTSPAEESFFGALTSRIRGRSRSRSRAAAVRKRSKSPMVLPPEQFPAPSAAHHTSATYTPARPQQSRHVSAASQGSIASSTGKKAPHPASIPPARRHNSNGDLWRGRHANTWLFNDFSVMETANKIVGRKP